MTQRDMQKAALRGEPSYVWRAGQQRRLDMIVKYAGERMQGKVLENGCGVGMYVEKMSALGADVIGLEYDFERAMRCGQFGPTSSTPPGNSSRFLLRRLT
jgi:hypothetical protein